MIERTMFLAIGVSFCGLMACADQKCPSGEMEPTHDSDGIIYQGAPFVCVEDGLLEGNASITGAPFIDGYFRTVLQVASRAERIADNLDMQMERIIDAAGMSGGLNAPVELGFQQALRERFQLDSSVDVRMFMPPCGISSTAAMESAAICDVNIPSVTEPVRCRGVCEANSDESFSSMNCDPGSSAANLCIGPAPDLGCAGSCSGTCVLDGPAPCDGICRGICHGDCSRVDDRGDCIGRCDGDCQGACDDFVMGDCDGACVGVCEYSSPDEDCQGGAVQRSFCHVDGSETLSENLCSGTCFGEIRLPHVQPVCQVVATALSRLDANCSDPILTIISSSVTAADSDERRLREAEFDAWAYGFRRQMSSLMMELARAGLTLQSVTDLSAATDDIMMAGAEMDFGSDLVAYYRIAVCMPPQLADIPLVFLPVSGRLSDAMDRVDALLRALGN